MDKEALAARMRLAQFPRSARYDIEWLCENEMGPCSTWLAEYLFEAMEVEKGSRILDLGCGMAMSSIFIAREYDVQVWAADLWIKATDNQERIARQGLGDRVFPINCEAHSLPFANGFFDAIVSLDAYHYFGTDELYLPYIARFLKPGGQIGIVVPGVEHEWTEDDRDRIGSYWEPYNYTHHTPSWWLGLWTRSECVDAVAEENMPGGYDVWLQWDRTLKEAGVLKRSGDVEMLELDGGNFTWTRVVGRKK